MSNKIYPWSTENARLNNLTVVKHNSIFRKYGYSLKDRATGQIAMWFKYKRDAIKKIDELFNCPHTPFINSN